MTQVMNTIRIDISHEVFGGWFSIGVGATDSKGREADVPCLPQWLAGEGPYGPNGFNETVDHVLSQVKDLLLGIYERDELLDESDRLAAVSQLPGEDEA